MGIFDKKYCDICGEKIGLLGYKKLEDGNMCKDCAGKLSYWFSERKNSTLNEIKKQLSYRKDNLKKVESFSVTRTLGKDTRVLIDEKKQQFLVARTNDIQNENPDVLDLTQVTGCGVDIKENRREQKHKDKEGRMVSYNPPRYTFSYDFYITINVNHTYFDDMRFKLNRTAVEMNRQPQRNTRAGVVSLNMYSGAGESIKYREYEELGNEIKQALENAREKAYESASSEDETSKIVVCPFCGASSVFGETGKCKSCGGSLSN